MALTDIDGVSLGYTHGKTAMATLHRLSREEWQGAVTGFIDYNLQQTWGYSEELATRRGAVCEHQAIKLGNELIGLAAVRIKQLPVIGGGIAYVAGGPLCRRGRDGDMGVMHICIKALQNYYANGQGMVLRILPPLGPKEWNKQLAMKFEETGFVRTTASQGYRTLVVDIRRPLKEIRSSLGQKWRNCLNGAEKKSLELVTGASDTLFAQFEQLFKEFHERKGFHVDLGPEFYRACQVNLVPKEQLIVSLVNQGGQTVAGHVSSSTGDTAVYLLGATNEEGLKAKAAYLLQWNAIVSAKDRGQSFYDLGGIDPEANPNVYHFKSGMNGIELSASGPFEYSSSHWRSQLARRAERMYRIWKQTSFRKRQSI